MATGSDLGETRRDGLPIDEDASTFGAMIQRGFDEPNRLVVGEERFSDALRRFSAGIGRLLTEYATERLAVATHRTVLPLSLR